MSVLKVAPGIAATEAHLHPSRGGGRCSRSPSCAPGTRHRTPPSIIAAFRWRAVRSRERTCSRPLVRHPSWFRLLGVGVWELSFDPRRREVKGLAGGRCGRAPYGRDISSGLRVGGGVLRDVVSAGHGRRRRSRGFGRASRPRAPVSAGGGVVGSRGLATSPWRRSVSPRAPRRGRAGQAQPGVHSPPSRGAKVRASETLAAAHPSSRKGRPPATSCINGLRSRPRAAVRRGLRGPASACVRSRPPAPRARHAYRRPPHQGHVRFARPQSEVHRRMLRGSPRRLRTRRARGAAAAETAALKSLVHLLHSVLCCASQESTGRGDL